MATIACSLLHLTPTAFRITVSVISGQGMQYYHGGYYNRPTDLGNLYSKIAMELCQGGARSLLVESQLKESLLSIDMGAISGLTSIAHGPGVSCASFAKLAYLNAPTLKMLDMRLAAQTEWAILIYGRTTTSAAYPNLASLTLAISGISYSVTWAAMENAAPFPALSKLSVSGGYPFDDDLLFRGNGGTMMSLCIPFSAIARNALGRFGVLKRGGATQMTKVSIDEVTSLDKEFLVGRTDVPIKQQVHGILEVARSLSTKDYTMGFPVYKALCVATSTAILQRLDFLDELIRVDGIISLVAAIPSLVSLVCSVASIGAEIGAIPENRRLSSLYAKHYPLSANFRVLQVSNTADSKIEDMAYTAMLLAVLCPNFACVDISPSLRNAFGRGIAWAAFNFPFEEHADTLRRLIYRK
ncbi:hypothetical protein GGI06_000765 [Coemansia sp. S85]|nr:hypothetical protein GGI06_000765 [Coemansia sp. S85]